MDSKSIRDLGITFLIVLGLIIFMAMILKDYHSTYETCSLNPLKVGTMYEVSGEIYQLNEVDKYYVNQGHDENVRLLFRRTIKEK